MNFLKTIYRIITPNILRKIIFILRKILFNPKEIFIVKNNSYNEDGLATNHVVDFLKDENFIKSYSEATKNNALGRHPGEIRYRAYIVNYFADYVLRKFKLEAGDFVELGTGKGIMAKVIMSNTNFNIQNDRKFYLFDTFSGIPELSKNTKELENIKNLNTRNFKGNYFQFVENKFSMYSNVELVKGELPGSLNGIINKINKIIFLHIDLNNAYSEIESIKLIYDKLSIGSIVVLDDYCYSESFREQKDAWDNFIKSKNNKILSLPTGQGIFLKI